MIKVLISGVNGKMGQMIAACVSETEDMVVVAGVDKCPTYGRIRSPFTTIFRALWNQWMLLSIFHARMPCMVSLLLPGKEYSPCFATTGYSANDKNDDREIFRAYSGLFLRQYVPLASTCKWSFVKPLLNF